MLLAVLPLRLVRRPPRIPSATATHPRVRLGSCVAAAAVGRFPLAADDTLVPLVQLVTDALQCEQARVCVDRPGACVLTVLRCVLTLLRRVLTLLRCVLTLLRRVLTLLRCVLTLLRRVLTLLRCMLTLPPRHRRAQRRHVRRLPRAPCSDAKVANREIWVGHLVIENGY
jgi:hypothetical protein